MTALRPWLRLLRPEQWTKNALVLAAFVFALGDRNQYLGWGGFGTPLIAAAAFCLLSSAVYILNDIRDAPRDRLHPVKSRRPVAAREVSVPAAAAVALVLLAVSLAVAAKIAFPFFAVLLVYFLLQLAYTFLLKRLPLLDVIVIALGFVLRALAGAAAIAVPISPWLLVCTLLLATFLALCKRLHEKVNLGAAGTRDALGGYSPRLLDQLIAMTGAATLVSYSIYTLWPETVDKFGTEWLCATIPFVLFGLFRYLHLVYQQDKGDQPERILLTDFPLLADIALYGLVLLAVLFLPR